MVKNEEEEFNTGTLALLEERILNIKTRRYTYTCSSQPHLPSGQQRHGTRKVRYLNFIFAFGSIDSGTTCICKDMARSFTASVSSKLSLSSSQSAHSLSLEQTGM
ncbi:hypothetical protein ACET3Z_017119 [Daucus carota]